MRSVVAAWAQSPYQVPLGQAATYGLLSGGTIVAQDASGNALPIQALGKAGASGTIGAGVAATAGLFAQGSGTVPAALSDLQAAQTYCGQLNNQASPLPNQLNGSLLGGGIYSVAGDATLSQGGTLTISGDTTTVIILNIAGNLRLEARSQIVLNGVLARHVYWNVGKSLFVAAYVGFEGNALVDADAEVSGAHFGTGAILSTSSIRLLTISAAVGHNKFYAPSRPSASCGSTGQNCSLARPGTELVLNGSFEDAICCPTNISNMNGTSDACFWKSAVTNATPDYFNGCLPRSSSPASVPSNFFTALSATTPARGYPVLALAPNSPARKGNAYAGIIASSPSPADAYHEYIYQVVPDQLVAGRRYYAGFSAHLAASSRYVVPSLGMLIEPANARPSYPAAVAALLSQTPTVSGDPRYIHPANSQNPPPQNRPDSLNWQRVGGTFTATAAMSNSSGFRLAIGNFTNAPLNAYGPGTEGWAYYFIDNVTLSPLPEAGLPVTLGSSRCAGGTIATSATLGAAPMPDVVGAAYYWKASPADPSLTAPTSANPTVSPRQTTTYSLTVFIPGEPPYTTQTTVTVGGPYFQNPVATYVPPAGTQPYDLGTGGTSNLTVIDARPYPNATVVFDGAYHVQGNLLLVGGTFVVNPGTVFYVDGFGHESTDTERIHINVRDAELHLNGATLQATCDEMWQGIVLESQGTLYAASANGQRSLIRDAQWALWRSWDEAPYYNGGRRLENHYYLADTDFLNNTTAIIDGLRQSNQSSDYLTNCTFKTDATTNSPLLMELYNTLYRAGGIFFYDFTEHYASPTNQPLQITGCTFDRLAVGISGSSAGATVENCAFSNCWYAALASQSFRYGAVSTDPVRQAMRLVSNTIVLPQYLPADYIATGGGTAVATTQAYPLAYDHSVATSTYGLKFHDGLQAIGNTLTLGTSFTSAYPAITTGVWLVYDGTVTNNTFAGLNRAIQAVSGDTYNGTDYTFSQNNMQVSSSVSADTVVVFAPGLRQNWGFTVPAPQVTLRCNTFGASNPAAVGVRVRQKTDFVNVLGSSSVPNGNSFDGLAGGTFKYFAYDANNSSILTYYSYQSNHEFPTSVSLGAFQVQSTGSPINACRSTGNAGINNRIASSADQTGENIRESFGSHDIADAQAAERLYAQLISRHPISSAHPGIPDLSKAEREELRQVATSATAVAHSACQLLQFYEPKCKCGMALPAAVAKNVTNGRVATTSADQTTSLLGEPHPSPANESVTMSYYLPKATTNAMLVLYDLTGRPVTTQHLHEGQGEVQLSVRALAAGLYLGVLQVEGHVLATRKLAVTH